MDTKNLRAISVGVVITPGVEAFLGILCVAAHQRDTLTSRALQLVAWWALPVADTCAGALIKLVGWFTSTIADTTALDRVEYKISRTCDSFCLRALAGAAIQIKDLPTRATSISTAFTLACVETEVFWWRALLNPGTLTLT